MSDETPMPEPLAFDPDAVGRAAELPFVFDYRGRAHLSHPYAGELTFTPDGTTARCDVALATSNDGHFRPDATRWLIHNRLVLPLEIAVVQAVLFAHVGGWRHQNLEPSEDDVQFEALIATSALTDAELPAAFLTSIALLRLQHSRGEATVRAALTDPVHPVWLELAFDAGRMLDAEFQERDASGDRGTKAAMRFGDQVVAVQRLPDEELVTGLIQRPQDESSVDLPEFRLPGESALLLLTVHEGFAYAEYTPESFDDVDAGAIATIQDGLERLRDELLDPDIEVDWVEGFRRVTELFASWSWPAGAGNLPVRQLTAIATTAMRKRAARHGRPCLDRPIDPQRIEQLSGYGLVRLDDGYALRCRTICEIAFRIEGDLAVGRARTIAPEGTIESTPTVLSARTFDWIAWALGVRTLIANDGLDDAIRRSLADPWFNPAEHGQPALAELTRIARRRLPGLRRKLARRLLKAYPGG